jgi:hypothetical protein
MRACAPRAQSASISLTQRATVAAGPRPFAITRCNGMHRVGRTLGGVARIRHAPRHHARFVLEFKRHRYAQADAPGTRLSSATLLRTSESSVYVLWPARKAWNCVCKAAGIVAATIHDPRHTYAVHADQGGVAEARLQKLFGATRIRARPHDTRCIRRNSSRTPMPIA